MSFNVVLKAAEKLNANGMCIYSSKYFQPIGASIFKKIDTLDATNLMSVFT